MKIWFGGLAAVFVGICFTGAALAEEKPVPAPQKMSCLYSWRAEQPTWKKILSFGVNTVDSDTTLYSYKGDVKSLKAFFAKNPDMLRVMDRLQAAGDGNRLHRMMMLCDDGADEFNLWYAKGFGFTTDAGEFLSWQGAE